MSTAPNLHSQQHPEMPSHVGGHPITVPSGATLWCEANMSLFTVLLAKTPPKKDRQATQDYRQGVDVARDMCSRLCPRFEECLKAAVAGPPVEGFVAGTTETERERHRAHLSVDQQPEPVNDRLVGLSPGKQTSRCRTDHDSIDAILRKRPEASMAEIARYVEASTSTIKRRKRRLAAAPDARDGSSSKNRAEPSMEDHVDTYYLIRETS